jgi:hypothetical protein
LHEKKKDGKAQRLLQVLENDEGLAECRKATVGCYEDEDENEDDY